MKAAILVEQKKPLIVDKVSLPKELDIGQVLVKIDISGICGSQIGEINGVKGADKYLPHLMGHEGCGTVIETGPGVKFLKKNDFKLAATKFSISNSSERGGEIGWVKETLLSEELSKKLKTLEIGQISKPIKYPNGYLILKINEKKEMKQKIDINKELNEKIMFERKKQLNKFSLQYYKKLKQNTKVDEY